MLTYMSVHLVHALCPWRADEDITSPGTGVLDSRGLPRGCWDSSVNTKKMLVTTEPSIQPLPSLISTRRCSKSLNTIYVVHLQRPSWGFNSCGRLIIATVILQ